MRLLALALLFGLCACSKQEPAAPAPAGFSAYADADKLFTCAAPSDWRVREKTGGAQRASFYGPASGPTPFSASISVYHYPKGAEFSSPEDYATRHGGLGLSYETKVVRPGIHGRGGAEAREKTVLVAAKDGFFALVFSAPVGSYERLEPIFQSFVGSFR